MVLIVKLCIYICDVFLLYAANAVNLDRFVTMLGMDVGNESGEDSDESQEDSDGTLDEGLVDYDSDTDLTYTPLDRLVQVKMERYSGYMQWVDTRTAMGFKRIDGFAVNVVYKFLCLNGGCDDMITQDLFVHDSACTEFMIEFVARTQYRSTIEELVQRADDDMRVGWALKLLYMGAGSEELQPCRKRLGFGTKVCCFVGAHMTVNLFVTKEARK